MNPAALIYLGMGILIAKIILEGTDTKGYRWLEWLQLTVRAASIVLLWPLVLFAEKVSDWFDSPTDAGEKANNSPTDTSGVMADIVDDLNIHTSATYSDLTGTSIVASY